MGQETEGEDMGKRKRMAICEFCKNLMKYSKSPSRAGETSRRKWR